MSSSCPADLLSRPVSSATPTKATLTLSCLISYRRRRIARHATSRGDDVLPGRVTCSVYSQRALVLHTPAVVVTWFASRYAMWSRLCVRRHVLGGPGLYRAKQEGCMAIISLLAKYGGTWRGGGNGTSKRVQLNRVYNDTVE